MPARPERAEKLWARLGELEALLASEFDKPGDWRRRALLRLSEEIAEEAKQEERVECERSVLNYNIAAKTIEEALNDAVMRIQARSRPSPREPEASQ